MLIINSSSLLSHVTPGNPSQATVTIVDNDGKQMHAWVHVCAQILVSLYEHIHKCVNHTWTVDKLHTWIIISHLVVELWYLINI